MASDQTTKREPIICENALVDGCEVDAPFWQTLDFAQAWVDKGPSPAGNEGPYLHVPRRDGDTEQRVYPRSLKEGVRRGIQRDAADVWWWVPLEEHDEGLGYRARHGEPATIKGRS